MTLCCGTCDLFITIRMWQRGQDTHDYVYVIKTCNACFASTLFLLLALRNQVHVRNSHVARNRSGLQPVVIQTMVLGPTAHRNWMGLEATKAGTSPDEYQMRHCSFSWHLDWSFVRPQCRGSSWPILPWELKFISPTLESRLALWLAFTIRMWLK